MAAAASAGAGDLGDRIAEHLCYPPSAERLVLSETEARRYRALPPLTGDYRDIQGVDARAWFEITGGTGMCRTPARTDLELLFCADVVLERNTLKRGDRRLCQAR